MPETKPPLPTYLSRRHPHYLSIDADWDKLRYTYKGGETFKRKYLEKFSNRESDDDYLRRYRLTPVPNFCASALDGIRNSIYQRLGDVSRQGGSDGYRKAVSGDTFGVDRRGSKMSAFLGIKVLTELLLMGRVGVFIDNLATRGETLAHTQGFRPYVYSYAAENILNWSMNLPDQESEFQALLLQDTVLEYEQTSFLPCEEVKRYRRLWINEDGYVSTQFYDADGQEIAQDGTPGGGPITLNLRRIPFVLLDIGDSLIKDAADYQISSMNLLSTDIAYATKSNFPIWVEQRDPRALGGHLKQAANEDGTATAGGQGSEDKAQAVGVAHGRYYDAEMNAPGFVHPSPEPLKVSMELQDRMENTVRKLVNLAVQTLATRASAESKNLDNQGLDAGLSFIGLNLEDAEKKIADHWASYENASPEKREVAVIKYPDQYSLKTDRDRIEEAQELAELMYKVPGQKGKKQLHKQIAATLLNGRVSVDLLDEIFEEIEKAPYSTSDPEVIKMAVELGLTGDETASLALGFNPGEHLKGDKDHAERLARIASSQAPGGFNNPGARGMSDLSANPNEGSEERAAATDTTQSGSTEKPVRGKGK